MRLVCCRFTEWLYLACKLISFDNVMFDNVPISQKSRFDRKKSKCGDYRSDFLCLLFMFNQSSLPKFKPRLTFIIEKQ